MQKLDVEVRLKDEELQSIAQETNAKRVELSRVSSSRSAIQQCQVDFETAQRTHDEFMGTYQAKSAMYKKQIKVRWESSYCMHIQTMLSTPRIDTYVPTVRCYDIPRVIRCLVVLQDATDQIRDLQETIAADATLLQDLSSHRNEVGNRCGNAANTVRNELQQWLLCRLPLWTAP
jgi:uncharacterized protein (DUF885 family)